MPLIQSVERALQILELFNEQDTALKITEISSRMQLHKSTVHSLLKTLQHHHYIQQDSQSGKYALGLKLIERGQLVIQSMDLRLAAKPDLQILSDLTGQTVHLVILDGREGVYIDKVEGTRSIIRYSRIGRRVPLHTSAAGKALIAWLPAHKCRELLAGYHYQQLTSYSYQSEAELLETLEKTRSQDFAVDDEENELGVKCFAVPIRDYTGIVVASISLSMVKSMVALAEETHYASLVKQAGAALSGKLGYTGQ